MSYQKLIIVGTLPRKAERKTTNAGDKNYNEFSVVVKDYRGDKELEFRVLDFTRGGDKILQYLVRKKKVLVEGQIDESGSIMAHKVQLL